MYVGSQGMKQAVGPGHPAFENNHVVPLEVALASNHLRMMYMVVFHLITLVRYDDGVAGRAN
jgi:hypothetical protein